MADREFVFSNPEVQKLIREKFVPLAMNDWYMRRQQDEEGKFFREMTTESPRGQAGEGTRQGRYVFTATGKFLGFNNNRSPERILTMLRDALTKWESLPADQKVMGSVPAKGKPDERFYRALPPDGAVIKIFTRVLEKSAEGKFTRCEAPKQEEETFQHHGFGAAVDHLWLQASEVAALNELAAKGGRIEVPQAIAVRLARYHLLDNTRGEPPAWELKEVRKAALFLTAGKEGSFSLEGEFHLETADGQRGFVGTARGNVKFTKGKLAAWESVVLGDHWGQGTYTPGARPGRSPLGFAMKLVPSPTPADSIAPQFSHWMQGYYRAETAE